MKRSLLLASVGLCSFTFACGSADDSASPGGSSSDGGTGATSAQGGAPAAGGTGSSVAGSGGSSSFPSGGAGMDSGGTGFGGASAGSGGSAASSAGSGGSSTSGGASPGGAGGSGGSGGAGQAGGAGAGPTLDPSVPPGKNFDLSHWALQLPVANGDSVVQISDLSTYTSQYFFTAKDGAMTFWCPVTGAHTPNTHYPRTELRELATGGDWQISGTHSLTATLKVTKEPPSKGTIIGQIHGNATGGTAEVLKLEWMTGGAIVASVEDNNDPATQINKPVGNYTLGELISYSIQLKNSTLTVTVTNSSGVSKTITSPYTASSWTSDKYYFKLGDYVQLNTGSSSDGGQVSFYSFAVKHGS